MPEEPEPPNPPLAFKAAEFESVNVPQPEGAGDPNDPLALLKQNRVNEKAANTVFDQSPAPVPRKWRKYRDYAIGLILVNGLFGVFLSYDAADPFTLVSATAGMMGFTGAWTWYMLMLVDDY